MTSPESFADTDAEIKAAEHLDRAVARAMNKASAAERREPFGTEVEG